jgi:hypothetical protein
MALQILTPLRLHGRQTAGELLARLGVSRPTLMRAARAAGPQVIVRGKARRTAYAARRALRGSLAPLPLYRVDEGGRVQEIARLHLICPDGCAVEFLEDFGWPLADQDMQDGWFEGLPYALQDMRPQGFLGRHFARRHSALLQVPENPALWSDDDALHALSLLGADTPGDLIVGEAACRDWLEQAQRLRAGDVPRAWRQGAWEGLYPRLAEESLLDGEPGSSAGGEFPKFTAVRLPQREDEGAGDAQHLLVKFSGADASAGSQRWADLLVCEHLAGQVLREHLGIRAAASRIRMACGRTFLEVDRFDRHGLTGRSGVVSWASLDGAFFGTAGRPWSEAGQRLAARGWLQAEQAQQLTCLWHFGQLIANTDMHDGNLAFQLAAPPVAAQPGARLQMAPVYDMLPMAYAPVRGVELPARVYAPKMPLPGEQPAWAAAAQAARVFWEMAAEDSRISAGFRAVCGVNAGVLIEMTEGARRH